MRLSNFRYGKVVEFSLDEVAYVHLSNLFGPASLQFVFKNGWRRIIVSFANFSHILAAILFWQLPAAHRERDKWRSALKGLVQIR